jgi:hypothetical protein
MIDWKRKLSSRKFWAMVAALILSVLTAFGIPQLTAEQVVVIVSGIGGLVVYMLAESKVDAASAENETYVMECEEEPEEDK